MREHSVQFVVLTLLACNSGAGNMGGDGGATQETDARGTGQVGECQRDGVGELLPDVFSEEVRVTQGAVFLKTQSTDCSTITSRREFACVGGAIFYLDDFSESPADSTLNVDDISVFVNGCQLEQQKLQTNSWVIPLFSESLTAIPGSSVVIEVLQQEEVIIRRSFQIPTIAPNLLRPTAGETLKGGFEVSWDPFTNSDQIPLIFQLVPVPDNTDPVFDLNPSSGQSSIPASNSAWETMALTAAYPILDEGFLETHIAIQHIIPINTAASRVTPRVELPAPVVSANTSAVIMQPADGSSAAIHQDVPHIRSAPSRCRSLTGRQSDLQALDVGALDCNAQRTLSPPVADAPRRVR